MRIGLFGGSFDPAHAGHAHVAECALARLHLDQVWWLVTPQNPLKPKSRPLDERRQSAAAWARGARMIVSDFEEAHALRYSIKTIRFLKRRYPGVRFVWVSGDDIMRGFHRWKAWRAIFREIPIFLVSRPGDSPRKLSARAFAEHARYRMAPTRALVCASTPRWAHFTARYNRLSSTALRALIKSRD
jgi:nicotinate-nucleotide adenylyltransferase